MHVKRMTTRSNVMARTLILASALLLSGCNVAAWGNIFVLGLTLALFCATLNLGPAPTSTRELKNSSDSEAQLS
jgi:hypothetical protein